MNTVTVRFTRRRRNVISWLIRWTVPRSRFALALSSHCLVNAEGGWFEATMLYGVRPIDPAALSDQLTVKETRYWVPNAEAGHAFLLAQVCRYVPKPPRWIPKWAQRFYAGVAKAWKNNYDWGGALGLGLAPGRDWSCPDCWYCYELAAGTLSAAGRPVFSALSHVGETALMAINP